MKRNLKSSFCLTFLIVAGALLFEGSPTFAQASPCRSSNNIVKNDGECWNSLSPVDRNQIVRGIWVGKDARTMGNRLADQEEAFFFLSRDWLEIPTSTTIGDITEYFDRLYNVPANRKIDWRWAYILAAMNARDDDSNDRISLHQFLREHGSVPTSGKLVGIRGANVVTIETDNRRFDVILSRASITDMNSAQRERAMSFLRGIMRSGNYADCNTVTEPFVSLNFATELFDSAGNLTAEVRLMPGMICPGDRAISIADLYNSSAVVKFNLGFFLVSRGLVRQNRSVDPKWSKEIKENALWEIDSYAKEKKLYLFGSKTTEEIDAIIKSGTRQPAQTARPASPPTPQSKQTPVAHSSGSGVVVAANYILTNAHVVEGCSRVTGTIEQGRKIGLSVSAVDKENDLALVRVEGDTIFSTIAAFRDGRAIRPGEPVTVIGYPLTGILASSSSITNGIVSNLAGPGNDVRLIQITAAVQAGNSGGPVLDQNGRLVGLVVAKLNALAIYKAVGDIPQNVNFAIKDSVVRTFLDTYGIEYGFGPSKDNDANLFGRQITIFIECQK